MLYVACSGFPIAVSRYLRDFYAVEVADSAIALPGRGSVRRWLRESPEGFAFSMLAPNQLAERKFALDDDNRALIDEVAKLAQTLSVEAVVFQPPEKVKGGKARRKALIKLLGALPEGFPPIVLDMPHWPTTALDEVAAETGAVIAADPLELEAAPKGPLAYLTLPGPAGHRSRYDEASLEQVAERCRSSEAETTIVVFRNIDMETNARRLMELVE